MDLFGSIFYYVIAYGLVMPLLGMCVFVLLGIAHIFFEWINSTFFEGDDRLIWFIPESWNILVVCYGLGAAFYLYPYLGMP